MDCFVSLSCINMILWLTARFNRQMFFIGVVYFCAFELYVYLSNSNQSDNIVTFLNTLYWSAMVTVTFMRHPKIALHLILHVWKVFDNKWRKNSCIELTCVLMWMSFEITELSSRSTLIDLCRVMLTRWYNW